jgi:hypothetical protein
VIEEVCLDLSEKDRVPVDGSEYLHDTFEEAKNAVRRISLPEEDLPFGQVGAIHCSRPNQRWRIGGGLTV